MSAHGLTSMQETGSTLILPVGRFTVSIDAQLRAFTSLGVVHLARFSEAHRRSLSDACPTSPSIDHAARGKRIAGSRSRAPFGGSESKTKPPHESFDTTPTSYIALLATYHIAQFRRPCKPHGQGCSMLLCMQVRASALSRCLIRSHHLSRTLVNSNQAAQRCGKLGSEDWQPTERSGRAELEVDRRPLYIIGGSYWQCMPCKALYGRQPLQRQGAGYSVPGTSAMRTDVDNTTSERGKAGQTRACSVNVARRGNGKRNESVDVARSLNFVRDAMSDSRNPAEPR